MVVFYRKEEIMFKVDFEFRKGILFVRLKGCLTKETYLKNKKILVDTIDSIGCNYIALNIDGLTSIDIYGINYISNFYNLISNNSGKLVICDKKENISKHLLNNKIPYVVNELDLFKVI